MSVFSPVCLPARLQIRLEGTQTLSKKVLSAIAIFELALDSIGYTRVKLPLVISCAHVYPAKDFTFENNVSV
jgi:hypothetical protein